MDFEKEIDQILFDIVFEPWMSEDDYKSVVDEIFEITGTTKEQMSIDIQTGINNGYSLEFQLNIIKTLFKDL